jgi:hypothetical protein
MVVRGEEPEPIESEDNHRAASAEGELLSSGPCDVKQFDTLDDAVRLLTIDQQQRLAS